MGESRPMLRSRSRCLAIPARRERGTLRAVCAEPVRPQAPKTLLELHHTLECQHVSKSAALISCSGSLPYLTLHALNAELIWQSF